ncbi:MAG: SCO family protein, partial [Chloroflexi bacterium]|nr:SCO family protein [Chloroflexota bacterium]
IVLGLVLAFWAVSRLRPHTFSGTVLQSVEPASDFTLTGAGGEQVYLHNYQGKMVILYFGYTFCPDVCPATLSDIVKAVDKLGRKAENVQVIMISVDPERDTPDGLKDYLAHFNSDFIGVTGTDEEVAAVAAQYGIFYERQEGNAATGYLVDHTATVLVVDQEGYLKLVIPFGTTGDEIAADLAYMLR